MNSSKMMAFLQCEWWAEENAKNDLNNPKLFLQLGLHTGILFTSELVAEL
jgi:hypothetical protein